MDGCDVAKFNTTCTDQYAPNTVGRVSQWGQTLPNNYGLDIGPWPGVTGVVNTGWYWRPQATEYGIDGAPSFFKVGDGFQLARGNFIVLAVAYPPGAVFNVWLTNSWWGVTFPHIPQASSLSVVLTPDEAISPVSQFTCTGQWYAMCQTTGGIGPAWFFDGTFLYVRLVSPGCYNNNQKGACPTAFFESHNAKVWSVMGGFSYNVNVTSCTGCTVQSTLGNIKFYQATDQTPPAFNTDWGTVIPTPTGIPTPKPMNSFSCPARVLDGSPAGGPNNNGATSIEFHTFAILLIGLIALFK